MNWQRTYARGVGLFGISASTSSQVLARRGEFGMLRHLGVTRGEIGRMLAFEGAALGTVGVVTGIPMEFQFGTNWALFSEKTGGVIGQTLAMEGIFAFFLESSFLALLIWGERRLGEIVRARRWTAVIVGFLGAIFSRRGGRLGW